MNKTKCWILMSLVLCLFVTSFVCASWKDTACVLNWQCKTLSKEYTQPYCIVWSDSSIDSSIDHTDCIRASLNNNLSSMYNSDVSGDKGLTLGNFETRNLIESYCKTLLWDWNSWRIYFAKPGTGDSWDWQQTFDSRQSIFVYALCSSFKDKDWNSPFLITKNAYLSWVFGDVDLVDTIKLKQRSRWKDLCSLVENQDLSDCDMSIYATEIFSTIMKDIFKIKYAQVLHVNTVQNFDVQNNVMDFMSGYFNMNESYIFKINNFSQTIDVLQSNQKYYKKVLDTVKIIDNSSLASMALASKCPAVGWNMTWLDFIACALHSSQWKWFSLTPSFVTMFYNEIMHYRIFNLYAQYRIDSKLLVMAGKNMDEKEIRIFEAKALDFHWYTNLQIDAAMHALHTFQEFNMTYPLHIWLLFYQERMKVFRDAYLSPIVTIFYSLSEKLQNVQLPN